MALPGSQNGAGARSIYRDAPVIEGDHAAGECYERCMSLAATVLLAALLGASGGPRKVPNMPVGWAWPPNTAMKQAGARCLAGLDAAGVVYRRGAATRKISTPVELPEMRIGGVVLVPLRGPGRYPLDCHLAAALARVAPELRALGVRALHFRTLHKYRTVRKRDRSTRIVSRHAIGLAVDVFEVAFEDGAVLRVVADWEKVEQRLQKVVAVFEGEAVFRTPLTPANDPRDHGDHVHLEAHMWLAQK